MDEVISIVLRARDGEPLRDKRVRETVVAAARALAEREGVDLVGVETDAAGITLLLRCDRIVALGFAVELRRGTDRWHRHRFAGASLWGVAPDEHPDSTDGDDLGDSREPPYPDDPDDPDDLGDSSNHDDDHGGGGEDRAK